MFFVTRAIPASTRRGNLNVTPALTQQAFQLTSFYGAAAFSKTQETEGKQTFIIF